MSTFEHYQDQLLNGNWQDRQAACMDIAKLGDVRALDPLVYTLDDQDASVRKAAYAALAHLNHPGAISPIINHFDREIEESVQLAAIQSLGVLRDPRAVPLLVGLLEGSNTAICIEASKALGMIRDVRALPALIRRLDDANLFVRAAASTSLGMLQNEHASRPLIQMLGDTEPLVREAALESLEQLGEQALVSAYDKAFFSPEIDTSNLKSLARRGDVRIVSALINRLNNPLTNGDRIGRLETILQAVYKPSISSMNHLVCTAHLRRFSRQKIEIASAGTIKFVGCRTCGSTFHAVPGATVCAVVDEQMQHKWQLGEGVFRVNWLLHQEIFDFNRVQIGQADDKTVVQFCLALSNDTDPDRPDKPGEMTCDVLPAAGINDNSFQILKRTFGEVIDRRTAR